MRDLSGDRKGYLLFFILKGGGSLLRATNTKYESEKSIKKSDVTGAISTIKKENSSKYPICTDI